MKKVIGMQYPLVVLVITIALYLVFYSKIGCKPSHAGFWLILAMGMALGVTLAAFFQWLKDTDKK